MKDGLLATPLAAGRLSDMAAALTGAALPIDDLEEPRLSPFAFALDGRMVGYGGLEIYGDVVLIRSIVVLPEHRGKGVGRRIVELLLAEAGKTGACRGYLLTTDAQGYFADLGFSVVDRRAAPTSILATREATALCPASAVLMAKAVR